MIELDVTAAIGILTALGASVAGAFGILWKAIQNAHQAVVRQLTAERDVERAENNRLNALIATMYERRLDETRTLADRALALGEGLKRLTEESNRTLDAVRPRRLNDRG